MSSALPRLCSGILVLGLAGMASARLPPPTEAQQQVVAEKKTATAAAAEKAKQELARAQDRAVDAYHANQNRKTATGQHQPGSGAATK